MTARASGIWRRSLVVILASLAGVYMRSPAVSRAESTAVGIGDKVPGFSLLDTSGDARSFTDLAGQRATVVVFLSIECPMSNGYIEPLVNFSERYREKGVNLLLIN